MTNNFEELNELSEKERELALKILNEMSSNGSSSTYNKLITEDYEEIPVTIEEFLHNPKYLGKGLTDETGRFTLFPYWENLLKEIYPDPLRPAKYNTLALTGGIGLGKSTEAVIIGCYELYRMLCLKNPYVYYGLQPIDLITFAVLNITIDAAQGVAWSKIQNLIQSSEWFMSRGTLSKGDNPEWKPPKGIELIYGSLPRHIIGRAVFWAFADEVSFQPNQDVEAQKEKAKTLINTASTRMQSRFMKGEVNPTILVLASSKRTEQSFMETFIEGKKKNESKTTRVVDEPQWIIRTDKDSKKKFKVAVGNKFLSSEVLPLNVSQEDIDIYLNKGFKILDVPIGYYENFIDDIDIALTDIAGISTSNVTRYISGQRVAAIEKADLQNLFTKEVITVGDASDDTTQYYEFIDLDRLDKNYLDRPLYVHMDLSESGDKTGIVGVWVIGKKPHQEGIPDSKELYYRVAFSVAIKAPKGHNISFEKNRQFIYWLREQGFVVKGISTDTFQSFDTGQMLQSKGFEYEAISVDRVDSDHICKPYLTLKNAIYEERIQLYKTHLLKEELIGLERNNNGKVDHGPSGINCFTGDTKVRMLDGSDKTFLELLDDYEHDIVNYVYTFNHETEKIEPKRIKKVFKSGVTSKLVQITIDNGEIIRCTPEHRFMTRLGEYIEAKDLIPNESLMPLYTKFPSEGLCKYRLYYEPMEDKWHYEHRQFAQEILDEKYLVHHKDCNPKNNRPDNLIWMSRSAHMLEHSKIQTGAQSPEARKKRAISVKRSHQNVKTTKNGYLRYYSGSLEERLAKKHLSDNNKIKKQKFYDELSSLFHVDYLNLDSESRKRCLAIYANYKAGNKVSFDLSKPTSKELKLIEKQNQINVCNYYNVDIDSLSRYELHGLIVRYYYETIPGYKEHIAAEISKNHKSGKYIKAREALSDRIWWTNGKCGKENNLYLKITENPPEGFWRGRTLKNHKVISVEYVDCAEYVYDIEVEDNSNFALSAGIFVHNSKDVADGLCGAIFNASKHAEQFAFEYGELIEDTLESNQSSDPEVYKKQITLDFEEELKKINNPLKLQEKDYFVDYGMGKAKELDKTLIFASQGIVVPW